MLIKKKFKKKHARASNKIRILCMLYIEKSIKSEIGIPIIEMISIDYFPNLI